LLHPEDIKSGEFAKTTTFVLDYETIADAFVEKGVGPYKTEPYYYLNFSKLVCLQHLCIINFPYHLIPNNGFCCDFSRNNAICMEVITEHPNAQIWQIKIDPKKTTSEKPVTFHQIQHPECIIGIPISKPIVTEVTLFILPSNFQGLPNDYSKAHQQLCEESNDLKKLLNSYSAAIHWVINGLNYLNVQLNRPETQQRLSNLDLSEMKEQLLVEYSKIIQLIDQSKALRLQFNSYSEAIQRLTKESHKLRLLLNDYSIATQQLINPNDSLKILLDEYLTAIKLINDTDNFQILLDEYSKLKNLDCSSAAIEEIQKFIDTIQSVLFSLMNLQLKANKQIQDFQIMIQKLLEKCSAAFREANSSQ
jgi:hypothetical protein